MISCIFHIMQHKRKFDKDVSPIIESCAHWETSLREGSVQVLRDIDGNIVKKCIARIIA